MPKERLRCGYGQFDPSLRGEVKLPLGLFVHNGVGARRPHPAWSNDVTHARGVAVVRVEPFALLRQA